MARRSSVLAATVLAAAVFVPLPASAAEDVTMRRLAGADRYGTAAAIARATFSPEATINVTIARGDDFADALSGVNVAGSYYGGGQSPILLSPQQELPAAALGILNDYPVHDGYLMGTPDVLGDRVLQQVAEQTSREGRLGGRDRYATNYDSRTFVYNIEADLPRHVDGLATAFLVSGADYADAIAVGPVSYKERLPLLITQPDRLHPSTRQALEYDPAIEQVIVVGGTAAVSEQVVRDVEALGIVVRRLAGANRQETAIETFRFAERQFGWTAEHLNLARGDGFADALAGAPHGGEEKAPILFTAGVDELGSTTRDFLRSRSADVSSIDVFGSKHAVSDAVVEDARKAATSR